MNQAEVMDDLPLAVDRHCLAIVEHEGFFQAGGWNGHYK